MIGNLLVLLLIIGLVVLFGWLTYRAIRARKLWVRITGGLAAGLLTLVCAALVALGGKGMAALYAPRVPAAPALTVAGTPEQVARGEYLVKLSCIGCHSSVGADGAPSMQHPLNGGWNIAAAEGFGFVGDMVAENLTPGGKLAGYTDGELFRTLRHRVDKDGDRWRLCRCCPTPRSATRTPSWSSSIGEPAACEQTAATGDKLSFAGAGCSRPGCSAHRSRVRLR